MSRGSRYAKSPITKIGKKRAIYVYEFEDHSVYVGLTCDYERRHREHIWSSNYVGKKLKNFNFKIIRPNIFHDEKIAAVVEVRLINKYQKEKWKVLNKRFYGSLGCGKGFWTKENIAIEAKEFKTRSEFAKKSSSAYTTAVKNGWLNEICEHMISKNRLKGFWSRANVFSAAKKSKTFPKFVAEYAGAYKAAKQNGWIEEIHLLLKSKKIRPGYWTKERCAEVALKCKHRRDFQKRYGGAYDISWRRGWLNEICAHMENIQGQR